MALRLSEGLGLTARRQWNTLISDEFAHCVMTIQRGNLGGDQRDGVWSFASYVISHLFMSFELLAKILNLLLCWLHDDQQF